MTTMINIKIKTTVSNDDEDTYTTIEMKVGLKKIISASDKNAQIVFCHFVAVLYCTSQSFLKNVSPQRQRFLELA